MNKLPDSTDFNHPDWLGRQRGAEYVRAGIEREHNPDCDVNDVNPDGIKKPCNCGTEGNRLKDEGMALVMTNTEEEWKAAFDHVGRIVAAKGEPFTSEDILEHTGRPPGHQNAIGAAMCALARDLHLLPNGYVRSRRPSRHSAVVASWIKP